MPKYKLTKGILIAIEGVDGAGKTTQTILLRDHFRRLGLKVAVFKEPTNGQYGKKIKELAMFGRHVVTPEQELELFIKDRIEDCKYNIKPALDSKQLVIIDRYYFSSIAYQGALGLDVNYILQRNEQIAIKPDLVVILDLAVKIGLSRISNFRNETPNHFEKEEYLEKVREIFRQTHAPYIQLINASKNEESVFNNLKNIVENIISPHISIHENQFNLFRFSAKDENVEFYNN